MSRIDFGKPGDPSGCYMPREWWRPGPSKASQTSCHRPAEVSKAPQALQTTEPKPS